MNVSQSVALAFTVALATIACSKKEEPAPQATSDSASNAAVASAAPSSSGRMHRNMCPSRIHGATATATDVDGGVMIAITATDDTTIAEVHTRASALPPNAPEGHRGRFCPEMMEGTTRTINSTKSGAEITLVPTSTADLARVRTDVRERLAHSEKRPD